MPYLSLIFPFLGAMFVLFIILKILSFPIKVIVKLLINALVGGAIIFFINLIGASFGFALVLNWFTAIIVGVLGIPGAILVAIYSFIF